LNRRDVLFLIYLATGAYFFRNRHRFFDLDPEVDNDISAVRKARIEADRRSISKKS
jgi:hypothetical protein